MVGANTTGAAIVSFNLDAFESYGKSQSYNAPVGTRDAFRYTTALNRLLADDARRVRIGDATVVFWSDRPEGGDAEEIFREIFGDDAPRTEEAEHAPTVDRLRNFLDAARQGQLPDKIPEPGRPVLRPGPLSQREPLERPLLARRHRACSSPSGWQGMPNDLRDRLDLGIRRLDSIRRCSRRRPASVRTSSPNLPAA